MSAVATAFPWSSLEATARVDVAALRELRARIAHRVRLDALGVALSEIVGSEVRLLEARAMRVGARAARGARGLDGGVGVVLAPADDDAPGAAALLEVESALAAAVVSRVLKRPPPVAVNLSAAHSPALAGAVAAVVLAAARRAWAGSSPLRVVSAGDATSLEAEFAGDDRGTLVVGFAVLLGDDAYAARLRVRSDAARSVPSPPWTARVLSVLGGLPLSLPIVACATRARVADVAALRPGDVWLPGAWPLELAQEAGAAATLRGPVLLAAPSAASGVRARLVEGGRLVLSGEADGLCAAEANMNETDDASALIDAVGDVPVVVRIEVGEARMAAREWASLGRGDVITLGRRVGELVVLRVGGIAVARGELVSVDGEVGVRIADRVAGDTTSS
jgi:flagellar motor switch/type III secretory pathway protein FliN